MNNRIKELRYVKASELAPDPRNPRRHPAAQRAALQSMLVDVGLAFMMLLPRSPGQWVGSWGYPLMGRMPQSRA